MSHSPGIKNLPVAFSDCALRAASVLEAGPIATMRLPEIKTVWLESNTPRATSTTATLVIAKVAES